LAENKMFVDIGSYGFYILTSGLKDFYTFSEKF